MKAIEVWSESIPPPTSVDNTFSNAIYCLCINPEGNQIISSVGNLLMIYDAQSGAQVKNPIKGSLDKTVIIWKSTILPEMRYSHNDSIQTLSFNPTTSQLFSGGNSDFCIWSPEVNNYEKSKFSQRILSSNWSPNGQFVAIGCMNGLVVLKDKKMQDHSEIKRGGAVWCLEFAPLNPDNQETMLVVASWDLKISFYSISGKEMFPEKKVDYYPLSISFFNNGDYFLMSGQDRKVNVYSREGIFLNSLVERKDWIWCVNAKAKQPSICFSTNDGNLSVMGISIMAVHGLHDTIYACREGLTEVVVQDLSRDVRVRIKCKELVCKVSVYDDLVAILLKNKIMVYQRGHNEKDEEFFYKGIKKINASIECSEMVVLSSHILICKEKRVQLINFNGDIEREWLLDDAVRYVKVGGGPQKKEAVILGLQNGQIFKILIDNSFPIHLISHNIPIFCLDINANNSQIAVVDDNYNLTIYDLSNKEAIVTEMNVTSVAFNRQLDNLFAYSSNNGNQFIRYGNLPPISQKINGFVVGFKLSKIFIYNTSMTVIDVPQTAPLMKSIEKKDFETAYKLACLGITDNDFKLLGLESLQAGNFEIAKKCFMRLKDLPFLDLTSRLEKEGKQSEDFVIRAEVLCYLGKFQEAANLLMKNGRQDRAVALFTEIKKWDEAKIFAKKGTEERLPSAKSTRENASSSIEMSKLLREQADWTKEAGDLEAAADLYVACREYKKAVEIFGNNQLTEKLIELCRSLDKNENQEALQMSAYFFKKFRNHAYAKESFLKLGDLRNLMQLHIDMEMWEEAFMLSKQNAEFLEMMKLPYADWLCKNDRYEEALKVFKSASRNDLGSKILKQLAENSVFESRFNDAASFFWTLALENLALVKNAGKPIEKDQEFLLRFEEFSAVSEIYYAYSLIHNFMDEPFQASSGSSYYTKILNAARFIISKGSSCSPFGVFFFNQDKESRCLFGFGKDFASP